MSISAKTVKELRDKTGLGMMDCKNALKETNGDIEKAVDWLRKKGLAKSAKLAHRIASEGTVTSYIHAGGKIGVLLELNCETDFTARNDEFQELAKDIAMHIAATGPLYIDRDSVPKDVIEKEKDIARAQMQNSGKPENVIEKIVEGKLERYYKDNCLVDQVWVKDSKKTIKTLVDEKVATIGEKMSIRRFVRYQLGEGLAKREDDFAAEVAKQAGA
ncbi:MAG: elongation factor Ts [Acidobacteria bacterium]|nr:MAG: elongation factor Ts [Acidobacteriota bacterium]PIE91600.1 MAG: elongation factor Ts [Acidobacteriota bacterium]